MAVSGALAEQLKKEKTQGRQLLKLDKTFAEFTDKSPTRLYRTETPTGPVFVSVETIGDGRQPAVSRNRAEQLPARYRQDDDAAFRVRRHSR